MALDLTLQNGVLNWLRGNTFPAPPANLYLSLHSDTVAGSNAEVSADLGGRIAIDQQFLSSPTFLDGQTSGTRQIVNSQAFLSGLAGTTVQVKSFAIWDAASGGNRLIYGTVNPEVTVQAGDPAIFLQGDLSLRID